MIELWNESMPKARREHKCECCGGAIKRGDKYKREWGKYDGEFFTRALHLRCAAFERVYCANVENEFTWDDIDDYIRDVYCPQCPHYDEDDGCTSTEGIYDCAYLGERFGKEVEG